MQANIPLSDDAIIELYWQRDEDAIKQTDAKYKNYLLSVAYNMLRDSGDCEECLNDTYLGTWNAIPPARPSALKAFLTAIMRRAAVNIYNRRMRQKRVPSSLTDSLDELDYLIAHEESVDSAFDAEQLGKVISDYVRSLSERGRYIFMSRYYAAAPIDKIASTLSVSRSTVNKEIAAIKNGLRKKLESEGYFI